MLNPLLIHISHQWLENLPSLYYLLLFNYQSVVLRFFVGELSGNKSIDISVYDVHSNSSTISSFLRGSSFFDVCCSLGSLSASCINFAFVELSGCERIHSAL